MVLIRVDKEVHEKLRYIKNKLKHRSFNETITYLMDVASSPKSFLEASIYFLEDLRNDVKSVRYELSRLVEVLDKIVKTLRI